MQQKLVFDCGSSKFPGRLFLYHCVEWNGMDWGACRDVERLATRREILRTGGSAVLVGLAGCQTGRDVTRPVDTLTHTAKLVPSDGTDVFDRFGRSVALAGDTALVGAAFDSDYLDTSSDETPVGSEAGAAYVFNRADGEWTPQAILTPDDGEQFDAFGSSVALGDDTALVGAPKRDGQRGQEVGAAYVFERADGEWIQRARLAPLDGETEGWFGSSMALAGDTILVGTPGEQATGKPWRPAGAVYVFERVDGEWTQQATLKDEEGGTFDVEQFGGSVVLEGDTAFIGAPSADGLSGAEVGAAYVFEQADGEWTQLAKLTPNVDYQFPEFGQFGAAVALAGDTVLIGAHRDENPNGENAGAAYVFEREPADSRWIQQAKLTGEEGERFDFFGESVAVAEDTALVGIRADNNSNGENAGAADVFEQAGGEWTRRAKLTAGDGDSFDFFGDSVVLADNTALIGAPEGREMDTVERGAGYIFDL